MPLPESLGGRGLGPEVGPVAKHPHEIDDVPDITADKLPTIPVDKLPGDVMLHAEHGFPPPMADNTHVFKKGASSAYPNAYNLKIICDSIVINFQSSSAHNITLPDGGFPNAFLSLVASQGDITAFGYAIHGLIQNNQTAGFVCATPGSWFFGLVRINYIAIGF